AVGAGAGRGGAGTPQSEESCLLSLSRGERLSARRPLSVDADRGGERLHPLSAILIRSVVAPTDRRSDQPRWTGGIPDRGSEHLGLLVRQTQKVDLAACDSDEAWHRAREMMSPPIRAFDDFGCHLLSRSNPRRPRGCWRLAKIGTCRSRSRGRCF